MKDDDDKFTATAAARSEAVRNTSSFSLCCMCRMLNVNLSFNL